jgi:hypothetical protein
MATRRKFVKRKGVSIVAVQLALDTSEFTYSKWGGTQTCKPGDWIVDNEGDVYTVDRETFARTYRQVSPGVFVKATPVWAEVATRDGQIQTKEGVTHYRAGAYLVYNDPTGEDGYAVEPDAFERMYEPAE